MSMTVDQNDSNQLAADSGSIHLPPTQPIDMTTLFTGKLSLPGPVGVDEH
jgi:hypothetical protein